MSQRERDRLKVMSLVLRKERTQVEAGRLLEHFTKRLSFQANCCAFKSRRPLYSIRPHRLANRRTTPQPRKACAYHLGRRDRYLPSQPVARYRTVSCLYCYHYI